MKRLALVLAALPILMVRPAHADTLDFTWQSTAWVKNYESPTQFTITGPFTLSGQGSVTFAELVAGGPAGRTLTFGGTYGGALTATGDGTYNGAMTFPTSSGARHGLGVLTPTADGFTLVVNRAASGPDAGAAFVGVASQMSAGGGSSVAASEPSLWLLVSAGLAAAARLRSRQRRVEDVT
jgi:hypothetical protein